MTGYKNPPKEHQFKPGQSGNPKGKPKGRKNFKTLFREIAEREVTYDDIRGVKQSGAMQEAIVMKIAKLGLLGDPESANTLRALATFIEFTDGKAVSEVKGEVKVDGLSDMLAKIGAVSQE